MKITFAPRGIVWGVWMKALFHEVCPETVNIRNVKNQPPPLNASTAVFEVQNRIPVFCAERSEIRRYASSLNQSQPHQAFRGRHDRFLS